MALIVEDGTGRKDAEAYISVADADAYRTAFGDSTWAAWDAANAAQKEAALRRGAQYLDGKHRFKGVKTHSGQALSFPRTGVLDADGREIASDTVPKEVARANCEAALRALKGELAKDLDRGGLVASKSVAGAVSTTYFAGAPGGKTFPVIDMLMQRFCASGPVAVRE
jgi:hypothetical protein